MPNPLARRTISHKSVIAIGLVAAVLSFGGYQAGRKSVGLAHFESAIAKTRSERRAGVRGEAQQQADSLRRATMKNIATVPFSQLYDVLRLASREQLLIWAKDLENLPRGTNQIAAVSAYYKSLVQVDPKTAVEAILSAKNLSLRDVAIDSMLKVAPESIWGNLANMMWRMPHPRRGAFREDVIWNWSRVDPEAASEFIESHPVDGDDGRLFSLLCNWGEIDPVAAKTWIESDPSRQTDDAIRALLSGWKDNDRASAIEYAVAHAADDNFDKGVRELAYTVLREWPDEARGMILRLPAERAKAAMGEIRRMTTGIILGLPENYQRPPEVIAPWMMTLPRDLWNDKIGGVVAKWIQDDGHRATAWLNGLPTDDRDAAITDLCAELRDRDSPEEIVSLGLTISDPKKRDEALGRFARGLRESRADAMKALNNLALTNEKKAYLRALIRDEAHER